MVPGPAITLAVVLCVLVLPALAVAALEWLIRAQGDKP